MSAVETPPPEAPTGRRCPRCGSELTPEQEWCLHCGADVGTRIAARAGLARRRSRSSACCSRSRRDRARPRARRARRRRRAGRPPPPRRPTPDRPTPTAAPAHRGTPRRSRPRSRRPPTDGHARHPAGDRRLARGQGRAGRSCSSPPRPAGGRRRRARTSSPARASPVGILNSDDYSSLEPGHWVVFSGQYDSQRAADAGADRPLRRRSPAATSATSCRQLPAAAPPRADDAPALARPPGAPGADRRVRERVALDVARGGRRDRPSTGISAAIEPASAPRS